DDNAVVLRFRRPRETAGARGAPAEAVSVVALTASEVVAGSVSSQRGLEREVIASSSTIAIDDAIVLRLDGANVTDLARLVLEPGRLIAIGRTRAASRPRIDKGIVVDVGPYVILAQLERRVADLDAGRLMCRAALVAFAIGGDWRTEHLGLTRIESGHARTVRTGTYEDFEVACTLRRVAAGG
ncbi:MAG TPA: hypothetical protein VGK63_09440, partial [Candidatus Limnocylindrales bacterium]